jgi:branched-chain amino acid aminotransferase
MAPYINFNGKFISSGTPVIPSDNRSFRYGDGLFETIRVKKGEIILADYHFERLFNGARLLSFALPIHYNAARLRDEILGLCRKNGHNVDARVRLVIFRGAGGLYDASDHFPNYIIESWALAPGNGGLNQNGQVIDLFPDGRKSCDAYANLKSNSFLLYVLAALFAKENRLNDCLVLNSRDRIADSTIANVFYCKGGKIYTPPLSEGCVAGVMRRLLLDRLPGAGFTLVEKETVPADLENAEEVFLTNAIRGVMWVQRFRDTSYGQSMTRSVQEFVVKMSL